MEAKEYIKAVGEYPPENNYESIELSSLMVDARKWSTYFGHSLLDYCRGEYLPKYDPQIIDGYFDWIHLNLYRINHALDSNINNREFQKAYSELNFHYLNIAMMEQWRAVFGLDNPAGERIKNIHFAQDYLSTLSLDAFCKKLDETRPAKAAEDFAKDNKVYRDLTENRLNEFDSAIILLEVMKNNPSLAVLPSPPLFEKYTNRANADFIIIDTDTRDILGVQTKTTIFSEELEKYDSRRIIFIDGRYDLANYKMMRTVANSSRLKEVSWNGLVAMHHLKTKNAKRIANSYIHSVMTTKELLGNMMRARAALGTTTMDIPRITALIEDRILDNLYKQ